MPYPKLKNENYQNLGGINQKASLFLTGANEALALLNFDFQRPGAYNQRPGSTQCLGGGTGAVLSLTEFSRLNGASWKVFNIGTNLFTYNGTTALIRNLGVTFGASLTGFTFIPSTSNILDMVPFVDRLFIAGSNFDFCKTDGYSTYAVGIPPNVGNISGSFTNNGNSGWTGWYQYAVAFVNNRGVIGPIYPAVQGLTSTAGVFNFAASGATSLRLTLPTPNSQYAGSQNIITDQYGLTEMVIFRGGPYNAPSSGNGPSFIGPLFDIGRIAIGACTFFFDFGTTTGPLNPTGITPAYFSWFTLVPRYLNQFNNAMFYSGFSQFPSTVFFSGLGEPEVVGSTASFEVRNDDGDRVTCKINYRTVQMIFKMKSTHFLSGFSSDDYALQEITDQYGCISNRAACVWQDKLWFLDLNGIAEYNGARVATVSNRVEQSFRRMNVQAAIDLAAMVHVKDRNEIWTSFPIDGASYNNYLVVYDYVADAFTEWFGPQPSALALATGPSGLINPFYGDYSGAIHYFDPVFYNDSGRAFTCSITSRFFGDLGYSVTKQFRRLFFDMTMRQNSGSTHVMRVNLFSDVNLNSVVFSNTFAISSSMPQQNRIDFGVPAKTMAFQLHYVAQDSALQFSGFTVEYRFQRAV